MPQRFHGGRIPPFVHINLFDFFVGAICLAYGLAAILHRDAIPSSIEALPTWAEVVYRLVMTSAGLLIYVGLGKGPHRWSFGAEIVGMIFAGTVFGVYAVGLLNQVAPVAPRVLAITVFSIIAAACFVRASGLNLESRNRLRQLREVPRDRTREH